MASAHVSSKEIPAETEKMRTKAGDEVPSGSWTAALLENPVVKGVSGKVGEITDTVSSLDYLAMSAVKSAVLELYGLEGLPSDGIKPKQGVCFVADTLIASPSDSIPISKVKPGDLVLSGSGTPVHVIAAVKTYASTTLYGFEGSELGKKPFFTGAHPFLAPSGDILVADKLSFLYGNPHMKHSRRVQEMPKCDIELLTLKDGKVQSAAVPRLTSTESADNEPLYFLVVSGDGSYVANGFVTLAELPDFKSWSGTFGIVMSTASLLQDCEGEFDLRGFEVVEKLAKDIKQDWEALIKNERIGDGLAECDQHALTFDVNSLGEIMRNDFAANLALKLYSSCGEMLYKSVDQFRMDVGLFVRAAAARVGSNF